jgi:TonB family protein
MKLSNIHARTVAAAFFATRIVMAQQDAGGSSSQGPTPEATSREAGSSEGQSATSNTLTKPPKLVKFEAVDVAALQGASLGQTSVPLELFIDAEGRVQDARVVESAGEPYDELARRAALQFLFEPAEIDGKPAAVRLKYRYQFTTSVLANTEAPSVEFDGVVRDKTSGQPLANVIVELDRGRLRTTTDDVGRFRFEGLEPGNYAVLLRGSSFTPVSTEETLEPGHNTNVVYDVELQVERVPESERADFEVVVVASKLEKRVESVAVTSEQATKVAGTGGDAIKVVENLPGVARSSVGSGSLVVWGSGTADTRVYVEGVHVPALYHEGGFRSVVHSDLVRTVELEPGGYGAAYGRGLGGLVTVGYKPLAADGNHGSLSADLIDAAASVRGNVGERWRFAVAGRRSHLDRTLDWFTADDVGEYVAIPKFWDGQIRVAYVPSPDRVFEIGTLSSSDRIRRSFVQSDPLEAKSESKSTGFHRAYVNYRRSNLDGSTVSVVPFLGTNRLDIENEFGGVPARLRSDTTVLGLRSSWSGPLHERLFATVGFDGELEFTSLSRRGSVTSPPREGDIRVFGQLPDDQVNVDRWETRIVGLAPFAQLDWSLWSGRVHVLPGLRFEPTLRGASRVIPQVGDTPAVGYQHLDALVEPRVAARVRISSKFALRGAVGIYHQPPLAEDLSPVFGNPQLGTSQAWHYLLGGALQLLEGLSAEVTGFYSRQSELVTRSPLPSPVQAQALIQEGRGRAYGGQVLLRKEMTSRLFGWVSYSLIRSERTDGYGRTYRPFDFDQTHVFTALASYDLGRGFEMGSRFRYATGYPRTEVVGAAYDARIDGYQPVFGAHNAIRIPSFYQLDARVAKVFRFSSGPTLEVYLDVQNVTNRKNPEELVYNYDYSKRSYITGLPLLPVLGGKLTW